MSEVFRNTTQYVYLDIYGDVLDAPPTATCVRGDQTTPLTVNGPETVDGDVQRWTATLGFGLTQTTGDLRVEWDGTIEGVSINKDDYFQVVVPLVSLDTLRLELELGDEFSDEKIILAERRVRRIIERTTGQVFAPTQQNLWATQTSSGDIRLPQRLISFTAVGGVGNTLYYTIAGENWWLNSLIHNPLKRTGIRAGAYVNDAGEELYSSGAPIRYPFGSRAPATSKVLVSGVWGYETVPSDIEEAAIILIEQQLCPDSLYAERYLKTMTAADFRFEFDPGAYRGTGNVIADQLLSKYRVRAAAVI